MIIVVLEIYTYAYCKKGMMLVGRIKVLVILYGVIVCNSCRWILAGIRAVFKCDLEVVPGVLLLYVI